MSFFDASFEVAQSVMSFNHIQMENKKDQFQIYKYQIFYIFCVHEYKKNVATNCLKFFQFCYFLILLWMIVFKQSLLLVKTIEETGLSR